MQRGGGEKILCRFRGRGGRERIDERRNFRLMRVADDPGDARQRVQLFRGALRVTAGDDHANGGVGGV